MNQVRLDPSAPLASLIAWLAAQLHALGVELGFKPSDLPLTRADAADVRFLLAQWRRQLTALVRVKAALLIPRLAARLVDALRRRRRPVSSIAPAGAPGRAASAPRRTRPAGLPRASAVGSRGCSAPPRPPAAPAWRDLDAPLSDDARAALSRRTRSVLLALRDPRAAIDRLARRLALRVARARQAQTGRRGRRRFPHPPRALGSAARSAPAPEPRPPDAPASA